MSIWKLAERTQEMNTSFIREILKLAETRQIISFAGGLPSPKTFPVDTFAQASATVLSRDGTAALQYAASEGFAPLREWVAAHLPWQVNPDHVLITTGSQQGLDLSAKILIDAGSKVLVETPTYLGALQAFTPMSPRCVSVNCDDEGIDIDDLQSKAHDARFLYLLPNYQNPTGRMLGEARRQALVQVAQAASLPLIEDNPYGDLWFDAPPPAPVSARHPEGCIYLGSFSKTLAPGLRLGYMVAPPELYPKLLQAKQAADLHTPSFNQRLVYEVLKDGFLDQHVPSIRALYKTQRDTMLAALQAHMPSGVSWNKPEGGMFLWVKLPQGMDSIKLLELCIERGVAFVPGAAFYADNAHHHTMRLCFVTASSEQIEMGVKALAQAIKESL